MIRLDKMLAECGLGSRREVKQLIRKKRVTVNGMQITRDDLKIDEHQDHVAVDDQPVFYHAFRYLILNKPSGVISATEDPRHTTVIDLVHEPIRGLYPVGRLDRDTEGLLLLTNDGPLGHALLSPKKHVSKTYAVTLSRPLTKEDQRKIETGIRLENGEQCRPAVIQIFDELHIQLTITEGKYHQIKRMIAVCGSEVMHLKRLTMGPLTLDSALLPGEYRECTEKEKEALMALRDH